LDICFGLRHSFGHFFISLDIVFENYFGPRHSFGHLNWT